MDGFPTVIDICQKSRKTFGILLVEGFVIFEHCACRDSFIIDFAPLFARKITLWQSNIFGKSLYDLVTDGLNTKIQRMPDDARQKLTKTLSRMINENTGGMICILL